LGFVSGNRSEGIAKNSGTSKGYSAQISGEKPSSEPISPMALAANETQIHALSQQIIM
jgi:hypothetical protein